jgi:hypothetical protein
MAFSPHERRREIAAGEKARVEDAEFTSDAPGEGYRNVGRCVGPEEPSESSQSERLEGVLDKGRIARRDFRIVSEECPAESELGTHRAGSATSKC